MRTLDWLVLVVTLLAILLYGLYKGRGTKSIRGYFLADRSMKWYTIALSIMATQASAVTFTSTPGQAYVDGMRFVQFYFGLPLAMVILAITAVPIFHKLHVYTAYEYLEHRFDLKTRTLTSFIFLVQRGLSVGITIYAPSLVLSVMLGLDIRITSVIIGGIVILYTTWGGVKSVNYSHFQQMLIITFGMLAAFCATILLLPQGISFSDALHVAGGMGKLNLVDFSFDFENRYNIWSGIFGGMFVALAYFGCDQSQVQRYLTGESVTHSRLALLFNGAIKIPMQFFILLIGAMVFVFYQFSAPPLFFNPVETAKIHASAYAPEYSNLEKKYDDVSRQKASILEKYLAAKENGVSAQTRKLGIELNETEERARAIRDEGIALLKKNDASIDPSDTNYIFLTFVLTYLPVGLVGLVIACIFAASMSSSSGELSALATSSVVDVYKRHFRKEGSEQHYLTVSRISMVLWGIYGIIFAQYASRLGSLVETVNILGSLFYGTLLGVFLLAFYLKSVRGTAAFIAAFAGEAVVFYCFAFTTIAWLWYNVIGCIVVVIVALLLNPFCKERSTTQASVPVAHPS